MTTNFASPQELLGAVGRDLGGTDTITITQDQINKFAEATMDNQWIHVDTERAKNGPFGAPIAHGYLTMSLASHFLAQLVHVSGISMGINYGVDKVRFPAPVPVGSKLTATGEIIDAKEVPGGVQAVTRITITREGGDRPVAIVDAIARVPHVSVLDAFRLDGKVAIVTGAGRGIGASIARTYADAGANILLAARTKEQLDEVAADVRGFGREAFVVPCDVNDNDAVEALVAQAVTEFGRLDIVVNNAGGTMPRPFLDTTAGFLERSFHFNVTTAFVLSKAATPHLLESGDGAIVNISSAIGRLRDRGFVAYGTAKGALTHMTRLMAADLAPRVRVNGIAVGSIATSALEIVLENPEIHAEMVRRTPLKRLGRPEDIAMCALYLASPAGSFVTGKLFEIDGGLEEANLEMGLPDL